MLFARHNLGYHLTRSFSIIFLSGFIAVTGHAGGESHASMQRANAEVMRDQVRQAIETIFKSISLPSGEGISVRSPSGDSYRVAQSGIITGLRNSGYHVFWNTDTLPSRQFLLEILDVQLGVRYSDMFRDGLFGSRRMRRTVQASMTTQVTDQRTGETMYSATNVSEHTDTIAVDDVRIIEDPDMRITQAQLPSESFIDRVVEPFVIIGAVGVAIYLFFQIRS